MQKMTSSQFQDWKDNSEFFFSHLVSKAEEFSDRMEGVGVRLADCNPDDIPKIHKLATLIGAQHQLLDQIINLEHEDIFGGDDE